MARAAFDTLRYSKKLQATGMSEKQAIGHAEALSDVLTDFADTLVTKDYLDARLEVSLADVKSTQRLHSWMLGVLVVTELVPLFSGVW